MQKYFCLIVQILLIFVICVISINAQDSKISLTAISPNIEDTEKLENIQNLQTKILQNVQRQVDLLKENLVNIVSSEEVASERDSEAFDSKGEKVIRTKNILSEYRISYLKDVTDVIPDCSVVAKIFNPLEPPYILQEDRAVQSVKESNQRLPDIYPYGVFTATLNQFYLDIARNSFLEMIVPFDKQYEKCFNYKLLGIAKIKERDTYVIEVMGKEKSTEEGIIAQDKFTEMSWNIKFGGLALIDAKTMEIFQFNEKRVNMEIINSRYQSGYGEPGWQQDDGQKFINLGSDGKLMETGTYEKSPMKINGKPLFRVWNDKRFVYVSPDGRVSGNELFIGYSFLVQTEYDKVKVNDQLLTLPVTRTVGVYRRRIDLETYKFTDEADWRETYTTRYSDYKAFNVETNINYEWRWK